MMTRPPSLAREIGQCAWLVTKFLAVCAVVIALLAWIFSRNRTAGLLTFYGLCFGGMIVFFGWQSYKGKKSDWEYQQRRASDERDRAERIANVRGE